MKSNAYICILLNFQHVKMSKYNYIIALGVASLSMLIACNDKVKPYAEYLKEENKAIERFIKDNNLEILSNFPADTAFQTNQFYRDPGTGVYYNILNKGVSGTAIKEGEEFYVRFSGLRYFANEKDTASYSTEFAIQPDIITYRGPVTMLNRTLYSSTVPAWIVPMPYIGHNARVKMIVPFNMGSYSDRTNFRSGSKTTYYAEIKYRFDSES